MRRVLPQLGEGTYGVVYRATDQETGEHVALKRMRMEAWREGVPATALREISVLKEIDHPNIVKCVSWGLCGCKARDFRNDVTRSAPPTRQRCFARRVRRLYNVFINHAGCLFLVFELLDRDLKHHMDLTRGAGLDVPQAKVRPTECQGFGHNFCGACLDVIPLRCSRFPRAFEGTGHLLSNAQGCCGMPRAPHRAPRHQASKPADQGQRGEACRFRPGARVQRAPTRVHP